MHKISQLTVFNHVVEKYKGTSVLMKKDLKGTEGSKGDREGSKGDKGSKGDRLLYQVVPWYLKGQT